MALRSLAPMSCSCALALAALVSGCASRPADRSVAPEAHAAEPSLDEAEAFLEQGEGGRAVVAFSRLTARDDLSAGQRDQVLSGLAHAHESVGDYEAARSTYELALKESPDAASAGETWARKGAIEAELGNWAQSAQAFSVAYQRLGPDALTSLRIELLARQAYAEFNDDRLDACDETLKLAEAVYAAELENPTERFATYYFVGMMRFYRAGLIHRQFRDVVVELPEAKMAAAFEKKLELLTVAQDAYNQAIRVKHVYWVSAAGYQLGTLFEEFYDELMHAPVPEWLDEAQKRTYYEELKAQLRPVVNKAIWVFEKNLESARRLGYENPFVEQTREALARLQSVLLDSDSNLGSPHPRLAERLFSEGMEGADAEALGPLDRKLHLPQMTPL